MDRFQRLVPCTQWYVWTGQACSCYCSCCERVICICSTGARFMRGYPEAPGQDFRADTEGRKARVLVCEECFRGAHNGRFDLTVLGDGQYAGCADCAAQERAARKRQRVRTAEVIRDVFYHGYPRSFPLDQHTSICVLRYWIDDADWQVFWPGLDTWKHLLPAPWRPRLLTRPVGAAQRRLRKKRLEQARKPPGAV